ncbi:MAG: AtpZ/AtpI family protein [Pseudomonadota bacterium]
MSDPDPQKLRDLEQRIAAAKAAADPDAEAENHVSMADMGWRMVIELTAGIVIGFGIGYGLDSLFGTMPIFLVLFIGFGLAAGIRTMMRTAQELQSKQVAQQAAQDEKG